MEQLLTIITLGVSDLAASAAFYGQAFGWTKTGSSNEDIIFYQLNGIQLALFPREKLAEDAGVPAEGNGFRAFTLAFNCLSEAEVDATIEQLHQAGARVVKEPRKVFWGGYSSYIADPDGNLWEIAYNPFLPMDEKGNTLARE